MKINQKGTKWIEVKILCCQYLFIEVIVISRFYNHKGLHQRQKKTCKHSHTVRTLLHCMQKMKKPYCEAVLHQMHHHIVEEYRFRQHFLQHQHFLCVVFRILSYPTCCFFHTIFHFCIIRHLECILITATCLRSSMQKAPNDFLEVPKESFLLSTPVMTDRILLSNLGSVW